MSDTGTGNDGAAGRGRSWWFQALLAVLFVVMAVEILLLVRQNRELKQTIGELHAGGAGVREIGPALEVGETVEPLTAATLDGVVTRIEYDEEERETLLLIFAPHCPACQNNAQNWKRIVEGGAGGRRFFYVSTSGEAETREFRDGYLLQGPVLLGSTEGLASYKITHIPATVVVGPGGVVRRVWIGILSEEAMVELAREPEPA